MHVRCTEFFEKGTKMGTGYLQGKSCLSPTNTFWAPALSTLGLPPYEGSSKPCAMSLSNITSSQLGRLIELVKEKEQLQSKLAQVNAELQSLESGSPIQKKRGRKPGRPPGSALSASPAKTTKRGKRLKTTLLNTLEAAGSAGMTVKELGVKLKVKPGNIFSWFYTTGKKVKGIKKVGEAKYSYTP
jgi:hypothetical protein